jgi:hypothetical protein
MLFYCAVLWMGLTEQARRSLTIVKSSPPGDDFVIVNVKVTSIDTARGLLYESIRLVPMGRFAIDQNTPSSDLKLLVNSASGKQSVVFPKGDRIAAIETSTPLSGNLNRYPFDSYTTDIDLLVTARSAQKTSIVPGGNLDEGVDTQSATSLIIGTSDLTHSETISIAENFTASITGVKFEGTVAQDDALKLIHNTIKMRRANNVISISLLVMVTMFVLAITIMAMALNVTASPGEINLLPLSLCIALIFGLPALRNIQPGVPGVGVLSDYLSFIWAELIVSTSAIVLAWTWISRARRDRRSTTPAELGDQNAIDKK